MSQHRGAEVPSADGTAAEPPAPRAPGVGRIPVVDALRGFALFGILVVNITYFASAYHGTGLEDPPWDSTVDRGARYLVAVLFETKFYLLFSFLFGYSFTLQLDSAARTDARFGPRFLRRLAALFALGLVHAVFLFPGDILTTYACLGLILYAARRTRPATAVRAALVLLAVTCLAYLLLAAAQWAAGGGGVDAGVLAAQARQATEALRGSPASVVAANLAQLPDVLLLLVFFQAPTALAGFLIGLAAGKRRLLADLRGRGPALRRLQQFGLPVGLIGGVVYAHASIAHPGTAYQLCALAFDVLTAPILAAAYAATVLRLVTRDRGGRVSGLLSAAGRMSLTGYLTQSLVCALIFTGYGAGMVGRLSPAQVLVVAAVVFAAQLTACRWWMDRHDHGPLEWLLRAATNAAWPSRRGEPPRRPPGGPRKDRLRP
ncbi:MAG TPA: DUF418 domain-containing protein [Pilimelia sp.]|nr:DUF418 domain-containing protein [Pilimelia sp.]